jgi:hypothetical protein
MELHKKLVFCTLVWLCLQLPLPSFLQAWYCRWINLVCVSPSQDSFSLTTTVLEIWHPLPSPPLKSWKKSTEDRLLTFLVGEIFSRIFCVHLLGALLQ